MYGGVFFAQVHVFQWDMRIVDTVPRGVGFAEPYSCMFYVVLHRIISGEDSPPKAALAQDSFNPPRPAPFRREFGAKKPRSLCKEDILALLPRVSLYSGQQLKIRLLLETISYLCPFETTTTPPPLNLIPPHPLLQPTSWQSSSILLTPILDHFHPLLLFV